MENKKIKKDKKITLYDILMMCGSDEFIDIVYNGYEVIETKEVKAVIDLLDILDDKLLNSLVFKLVDNSGKIRIYTTDAEEKKESIERINRRGLNFSLLFYIYRVLKIN